MALVVSGYVVFAVNPLQAARYRDRHAVPGAKSVPAAEDVLPAQGRGPGLAVPAGQPGIMDLHAQHPVPARI
jgi:hypothetical protein